MKAKHLLNVISIFLAVPFKNKNSALYIMQQNLSDKGFTTSAFYLQRNARMFPMAVSLKKYEGT